MNDETLRVSKLTDSIDLEVMDHLAVGNGGTQADVYRQTMELAKTMSIAKYSIPVFLRGNLGDCLTIRELAMETGFGASRIARHTSVIKDVLSFDGQLVHAIILRMAPLQGRPRFSFEGEGDEKVCVVTGTFKGEVEPCVYRSPPLGKITPKNSPLWATDPEQQFCYFSIRRWARRYCPDVLLGIYSKDDIEDSHIGAENAKDVSPNLIDRLPGRIEGDGFQPNAAELQREEKEAVAVVQAAKSRKGRPKGSRNKPSMKDLPDIKPFPEEGGLTGDIEYATMEATEKPVEASLEAAISDGLPLNPPPQAAASPSEAVQPPMDRGMPRNQGEYIAYAERKIRGYGANNVEEWFMGSREAALRAQCNVNDLTFKMLGTLVREKANGQSLQG